MKFRVSYAAIYFTSYRYERQRFINICLKYAAIIFWVKKDELGDGKRPHSMSLHTLVFDLQQKAFGKSQIFV